ncbi:MAG: hypothetical protein R2729_27115 [Bryobacteraceae bacterium]
MQSRFWTWAAFIAWAYPVAWITLAAITLTAPGAFRMVDLRQALWLQAALTAAAAVWLWRGGRVAACAVSMSALSPALFWGAFAFGPRRFWMPWVGLLAAAALLVAALRRTRLSLSWSAGTVLLAAIAMPFVSLTRPYPARSAAGLSGAVAILLVLSRVRNSVAEPALLSWRPAAAGLLLSASLAGISWWLPSHRANVRITENRRVLESIPRPPHNGYQRDFFQRGVSFTAEGGVAYDSPAAREMLTQLPAYGVNAIALVPYGFNGRGGGPLRIQPAGAGSWENDDGIRILAALAQSKGMSVMLKPHVWRVRMEQMHDPDFRRAWFEQYGGFIVHYARLAESIHASLFAIGTELAAATAYADEWRRIITEVRRVYHGPLTYAANHGPEFESVAFWDALDYIGIDNYYPLPDDYSTADMARRITAVHSKFNKPVIFTEAGYSAVENAHRAPWEDETDKPISLAEQERCYRALLESFYEKEWFYGVYWWKVGTNGYGGPDNNSMTPWRKPAMDLVKTFYLSGRR